MDEVMQIVFEIKENLTDADYMRLVGKITEVNPTKDIVVEYPCDINGINSVVTASPKDHIHNLNRKYRVTIEKYTKDTTRYLKMIADLTEDNMKLRKEADEWDDDDLEDDE
tara:strand:+ start:1416 stop:1748 length:333 start_codon:yes stop_codon:yes gene_type:complete